MHVYVYVCVSRGSIRETRAEIDRVARRIAPLICRNHRGRSTLNGVHRVQRDASHPASNVAPPRRGRRRSDDAVTALAGMRSLRDYIYDIPVARLLQAVCIDAGHFRTTQVHGRLHVRRLTRVVIYIYLYIYIYVCVCIYRHRNRRAFPSRAP